MAKDATYGETKRRHGAVFSLYVVAVARAEMFGRGSSMIRHDTTSRFERQGTKEPWHGFVVSNEYRFCFLRLWD